MHRFLGEVVFVDAGADQFLIETRQGTLINLDVDDQTKFRSPNGEINGLADLEVGMTVAAGGVPQDNGTYLAKWVGATDQPLPKVPIRVQGKIVTAGEGKFSVETPGGDTLNFIVTDETKFRSRSGEINSVEALKPGMIVGVGAEMVSEGVLQANLVLVGG